MISPGTWHCQVVFLLLCQAQQLLLQLLSLLRSKQWMQWPQTWAWIPPGLEFQHPRWPFPLQQWGQCLWAWSTLRLQRWTPTPAVPNWGSAGCPGMPREDPSRQCPSWLVVRWWLRPLCGWLWAGRGAGVQEGAGVGAGAEAGGEEAGAGTEQAGKFINLSINQFIVHQFINPSPSIYKSINL